MSELKYCKNCKHCRPTRLLSFSTFGLTNPYDLAKCARPMENDLISGNQPAKYCSCERQSYITIDTCGKDAKYYEPKN